MRSNHPHMMKLFLFLLFTLLFTFDQANADDDPGFNGRKMTEWLAILKNDSLPRKRRAAVIALGQITTENKECRKNILPALANAVKSDPEATVRSQAASILGQQPPEFSAAFITELSECLRTEKEATVKKEVCISIGRMGKLAKSAVLPIQTMLKDSDPVVRSAAAECLGRIGGDAKSATASLLELLKDSEQAVRVQTIFALGRVDSDDAEPTLNALIEIIGKEKSREIRYETVVSLGIIGVKTVEVANAIASTLNDEDLETRKQACLALAKLGYVAKKSEDKIRFVLKNDSDKEVRSFAVRALTAAYGTDAVDIVPVLIESLNSDKDYEVRVVIAEELSSLGAAGKSAIPALRTAMKDPHTKVRDAAANAIKNLEKPAPKPMPNP